MMLFLLDLVLRARDVRPQLVSVAAAVGDPVEVGQELAVIEAMKMQNVLRAPRGGIVKALLRHPGDAVQVDEILMEFE